MIKPQIEKRRGIVTLPAQMRGRARVLLEVEDPAPPLAQHRGSLERCNACGRSRDRTKRRSAYTCGKWTCKEHLRDIFVNCISNNILNTTFRIKNSII